MRTVITKYNQSRNVDKTSVHLFRHTFARTWLVNGGDIYRLKEILGHSSLAMVLEYVNMFSSDLRVTFNDFNALEILKRGSKETDGERLQLAKGISVCCGESLLFFEKFFNFLTRKLPGARFV